MKREDRALFVALLALPAALLICWALPQPSAQAKAPDHQSQHYQAAKNDDASLFLQVGDFASRNHDAIEALAAIAAVCAAVWLALVTRSLWQATHDLAVSTRDLASGARDQVEEMRNARSIAMKQTQISRLQAVEMRRSRHVADDGNRIARDHLRTIREQSRAFVFVEDIENRVTTRFQRGGFDPDVGGFTMTPRWKNSGDTPTVGLTLVTRAYAAPGDLPVNFVPFYERSPVAAMIGPKGNEWSVPLDLTADTANKIFDGELNLYVWGRAEYKDVFGASRFTEFCSRVEFVSIDREIVARFIPYGSYNRTDADST